MTYFFYCTIEKDNLNQQVTYNETDAELSIDVSGNMHGLDFDGCSITISKSHYTVAGEGEKISIWFPRLSADIWNNPVDRDSNVYGQVTGGKEKL